MSTLLLAILVWTIGIPALVIAATWRGGSLRRRVEPSAILPVRTFTRTPHLPHPRRVRSSAARRREICTRRERFSPRV